MYAWPAAAGFPQTTVLAAPGTTLLGANLSSASRMMFITVVGGSARAAKAMHSNAAAPHSLLIATSSGTGTAHRRSLHDGGAYAQPSPDHRAFRFRRACFRPDRRRTRARQHAARDEPGWQPAGRRRHQGRLDPAGRERRAA